MILYKSNPNKKERAIRKLSIEIEEAPQRTIPIVDTAKNMVKFIFKCESMIRTSPEYKKYMKFLKQNINFVSCVVLKGIKNDEGKKYSIEIHHEPFSLFDIVETVINKFLDMNKPLNMLMIADEVMYIHYQGMVGLIPLSVTVHELVTDGKLFIPLQYIYQNYNKFYEEYEAYFSEKLKAKIDAKVAFSLKSSEIQCNLLDAEFTYVNVDGFDFPEVPDEWKDIFKVAKNLNNIKI